jgi:chitodextrinase
VYKSTYKSTKLVLLFSAFPSFLDAAFRWSQKLRSNVFDLIQAFARHTAYSVLLLMGGASVALSSPLPMPNSEMNYPGASANSAFIAKEPYVVNIQGTMVTIPLWGSSRRYDFSGNAPFINLGTGKADPAQMQAWDPVFASSFTPYLSGDYNLNDNRITNAGFPGRVDKRSLNGSTVTMIRYNAGDGITVGKCRSTLNGYAVPPRTHARWDLEVAFGNPDGVNDWTLTPTWKSPVLFWQMHSMNQSNPPLAANVDTDANDPTKLMITFFQRIGTATQPTEIARVNGISRNTMVPIVIEAFLDERTAANGGKGLLQISVNNTLVLEKAGPTLATGTNPHWWSVAMYSWNDPLPSPNTRASFWKTAKMTVFPVGTTDDTIEPSAPANLTATAPDSTKVNLLWGASTDNVGVTGYKIHRDGVAIGYSTTPSFTDTTVVAGVTYNYMIKAYDAAGNFSVASNTATVTVTTPVSTVDTIKPSAPANLTATASASTKVSLSWGVSTDNVAVTGYKITRNGTGVGYSTTGSFTDTTVVAGTTYSYEVQAYDAASNFSVASNMATVKTPLASVNITSYYAGNITSTSATINWTTNIPATGVISYGTSASNLGSQVSTSNSVTSSSAIIKGLSRLTTYYYKVNVSGGTTTASSTISSFKTSR